MLVSGADFLSHARVGSFFARVALPSTVKHVTKNASMQQKRTKLKIVGEQMSFSGPCLGENSLLIVSVHKCGSQCTVSVSMRVSVCMSMKVFISGFMQV